MSSSEWQVEHRPGAAGDRTAIVIERRWSVERRGLVPTTTLVLAGVVGLVLGLFLWIKENLAVAIAVAGLLAIIIVVSAARAEIRERRLDRAHPRRFVRVVAEPSHLTLEEGHIDGGDYVVTETLLRQATPDIERIEYDDEACLAVITKNDGTTSIRSPDLDEGYLAGELSRWLTTLRGP